MQVGYIEKKYHFSVIAFIIACIGLYGIGMVFFNGQEHSYGVSREVPFGLLLVGYAFFVGISVGLSIVSTISHMTSFKFFHFKSIHIALLSLTTLLAAFYLIFWELGGPFELQVFRFIKYYTNFETSSPIWWMSTFYILETPLLALEVYLLKQKNEKAIFYAGILGFFLGIIAFSTLSMVFAVNAARPIWHSAHFTISFVLGALICGVSATVIMSFLRQKSYSKDSIQNLSKMLFIFLVCIGFIHLWTAVIALYQGGGELKEQMQILTNGNLSFNYYIFEIFLGCLLPMTFIILGKFSNLFFSFLASLFAMLGVFFSRYDGVIGGQLSRVENSYVANLPTNSYFPTFAEISIFVSAIGVAFLLYELGVIFLKIGEQNA